MISKMNQRSILIIEEDRGIQEVAKFCLEMDGHWQVDVANCGAEGFLKAKTIAPDVILLDSVALDREKVEILERLQSDRATQNIPIILFTTKLLDLRRLKCQNSSSIGTIDKPFDPLTLSKNIVEILQTRDRSIAKVASFC